MIALLVIIAVAARSAWPHVVHAVEIAAWTVAGMCGAAILATGGVLTARALRRRRARHAVTYRYGPPVVVVVDETQTLLARPFPPAGRHVPGQIEPPHDAPRWPITGWQSTAADRRPDAPARRHRS